MTITYCRNDPFSSRWVGINALLTEYQIDFNFYQHETRIATLETNYTLTVSIGTITQPSPDQLLITMTDASTRGPFDLPVATFVDRGAWAPLTGYSVNDTFDANGTLYRVIFAHTSASTFSPTANDGAGHDYYSAMLSLPGNALPSGGATAQVLQKSSSTDYAVTWGYKLPTGGTTNQVLLKQSSTNQDAAWNTLGATMVSFHGSTASGLTSTNVAAAIEEIETNLHTLAGTITNNLHQLADVSVVEGSGIDGFVLTWNNTDELWEAQATSAAITIVDTIEFVIDGGGTVITTGLKGIIEVPYSGTITSAKMLADQTGSVVVDIWKCSYSQYDAGATHPTSGDKITATSPPTISTAVKSTDSTLASWTTSITAGDLLAFNVNSVTSIQRVTISLTTTRTV